MKESIDKSIRRMFGWIKGADAWMLTGNFLTLIWFVVDWCMSTTFRSMSNPQLYLINFSAALVLLLPWMLTRNRVVGLLVLVLIALLSEANLIYCRTYFTAIPPGSYLLAGNMMDFTDSIWPNLRWTDIGFVVIIAITMIALNSRKADRPCKNNALLPYGETTCLFVLLSYIYILCLGGFFKAYDDLTQMWMTSTTGVPTYTVAGHVMFKLMEDARLNNPGPEEIEAVEDWIRNHNDSYKANIPEKQKKNVVLIICESLESWPIGLEIEGKAVTPFLNTLVNDSTTFYAPHVMTQVCNGHSIDGQLIYTTGLLPTSSTVYSIKYPERNYPSLNKILKKDRNAKSILMTTDKPLTWNMMAVENAFGYDTVLHRYNWVDDEMLHRNVSDGSFFRQSVAKLKNENLWPEATPAMLTFITFSGHTPFLLSRELKDPNFVISKSGLPKLLEDYILITHYVDSQLSTVVDYIKSRSDYEDTMIVILGDHEGLGVNRQEFIESSQLARKYIGRGRYTPFIAVNSPVRGRYEGVLGQIDVFPTLLDLLGVDNCDWRGMGVSLLDPSKPKIAVSEIPKEIDGDTDNCPADILEHLKSAQSVSEMIIKHDLLDKILNSNE